MKDRTSIIGRFLTLLITVSAMSRGCFVTIHYQNTTNDNRKHKR